MYGKVLSVSRNSRQPNYAAEVPIPLVEKYKNLPSPFYTVDYAELSDGSWEIPETDDGQVSGLTKGQNAEVFFKRVRKASDWESE